MAVFVVVWETAGGLEKGAALFESWKLAADDVSEDEVEILRHEASNETETDRCRQL